MKNTLLNSLRGATLFTILFVGIVQNANAQEPVKNVADTTLVKAMRNPANWIECNAQPGVKVPEFGPKPKYQPRKNRIVIDSAFVNDMRKQENWGEYKVQPGIEMPIVEKTMSNSK